MNNNQNFNEIFKNILMNYVSILDQHKTTLLNKECHVTTEIFRKKWTDLFTRLNPWVDLNIQTDHDLFVMLHWNSAIVMFQIVHLKIPQDENNPYFQRFMLNQQDSFQTTNIIINSENYEDYQEENDEFDDVTDFNIDTNNEQRSLLITNKFLHQEQVSKNIDVSDKYVGFQQLENLSQNLFQSDNEIILKKFSKFLDKCNNKLIYYFDKLFKINKVNIDIIDNNEKIEQIIDTDCSLRRYMLSHQYCKSQFNRLDNQYHNQDYKNVTFNYKETEMYYIIAKSLQNEIVENEELGIKQLKCLSFVFIGNIDLFLMMILLIQSVNKDDSFPNLNQIERKYGNFIQTVLNLYIDQCDQNDFKLKELLIPSKLKDIEYTILNINNPKINLRYIDQILNENEYQSDLLSIQIYQNEIGNENIIGIDNYQNNFSKYLDQNIESFKISKLINQFGNFDYKNQNKQVKENNLIDKQGLWSEIRLMVKNEKLLNLLDNQMMQPNQNKYVDDDDSIEPEELFDSMFGKKNVDDIKKQMRDFENTNKAQRVNLIVNDIRNEYLWWFQINPNITVENFRKLMHNKILNIDQINDLKLSLMFTENEKARFIKKDIISYLYSFSINNPQQIDICGKEILDLNFNLVIEEIETFDSNPGLQLKYFQDDENQSGSFIVDYSDMFQTNNLGLIDLNIAILTNTSIRRFNDFKKTIQYKRIKQFNDKL